MSNLLFDFVFLLSDYNARKPFEDNILSQIINLFTSTINEISAEPAVGVMGKEKRLFIEALSTSVQDAKCGDFVHELSKPLIDLVLSKKKVAPSAQFEEALKKLKGAVASF